MKQTLFAVLCGALLAASCKKTKEEAPPPEPTYHLQLSKDLIQAPAPGDTTTVDIDANAEWKVTIPAGTDWLAVSNTSGTGDAQLEVRINKVNNTGARRTATITVALVNGKAPAKQITVEQEFEVVNTITLDWKKLYGGNGNDYGYSIIKTNDGGFLLSGRTTSSNGDITQQKGGIDMWVAKLDATGAIQWQKSYGGNADELSVAAAATPDGGYVLTGYTLSNNNGDVGQNHGNTDFWVIKINGTGTLQWQKTLGGTGDDRPNAITVTNEGRIAVTGYSMSNNGDVGANKGGQDLWVMLLDNGNGNFLWKKNFGGTGDEVGKAIVPAPNGGVYVGATTTSNNNGDVGPSKGSKDFWVLHLDRNLSIVWQKTFGGSNIEELNALTPGPNNTLIAAGSTKSNNNGDVGALKGGEDMWIVQINATTGALGWQKIYGGVNIEVAKGIISRANGDIVVAGYTYSNNSLDVPANHGAGEFWILGLNGTGGLAWSKTMGGDNEDLAHAIAESADGFIISGSTLTHNSGDVGASKGNSDMWVVKFKDN